MKPYVTGLALAALGVLSTAPVAADGDRITPPPVPPAIRVQSGYKPFLVGHAIGTQGYVCVAVGSTFSWATFGPQATLFDEYGRQILTHFLSPSPFDSSLFPTWQDSRDTSAVWAQPIGTTDDPSYVAPGAIPWLLLEVVIGRDGPTGGNRMTPAVYIQRLNTAGGKAPAIGCAEPLDIKKRMLVPYEADYYFYR